VFASSWFRRRRVVAGGAAAILGAGMLVGQAAIDPVAQTGDVPSPLRQTTPPAAAVLQPDLSIDEAVAIAQGEVDGNPTGIRLLYEVTIGERRVLVDAMTGQVAEPTATATAGQPAAASPAAAAAAAPELALEAPAPTVAAPVAPTPAAMAPEPVAGVIEPAVEAPEPVVPAPVASELAPVAPEPAAGSAVLTEGGNLLPEAALSVDQAVGIAQGAVPGPARNVELLREGGLLLFEVRIGDVKVYVDAITGGVVEIEPAGRR
jgi:uncharacterized membrane protein YkoI